MSNNNKPEQIKIANMAIGDEIAVPYYKQIGWSNKFRYPIWRNENVIRVTPKQTKVITNNGEYTDSIPFAKPSEITRQQTEITRAYIQASELITKVNDYDLSKLSDEVIIAINEKVKDIVDTINQAEIEMKSK